MTTPGPTPARVNPTQQTGPDTGACQHRTADRACSVLVEVDHLISLPLERLQEPYVLVNDFLDEVDWHPT